jgi:hypothetical protein
VYVWLCCCRAAKIEREWERIDDVKFDTPRPASSRISSGRVSQTRWVIHCLATNQCGFTGFPQTRHHPGFSVCAGSLTHSTHAPAAKCSCRNTQVTKWTSMNQPELI